MWLLVQDINDLIRMIMPAAYKETVLKLSHLPLKLRFSGKCLCFEKSLSREHFPEIFQPPGDVYLLNIELESFEYVL